MKVVIVSGLVSAALTGGWVAHDQLPALTGSTPPAATPAVSAPATAEQVAQPPAEGVVVVVVTDQDGKTVTYQAQPAKPQRKEATPPRNVAASPTATRTSSEDRSTASVADTSSAPTSSATPTGAPTATPAFTNCAAVRAAGKAPIHRGDPGWADKLDRNSDGVAC